MSYGVSKWSSHCPCGGSTLQKCYVDETRKCIWYSIYNKSVKLGREEKLMEVLPPLDWDKAGTETWGDVIRQVRKTGNGALRKSFFAKKRVERNEAWESIYFNRDCPAEKPEGSSTS